MDNATSDTTVTAAPEKMQKSILMSKTFWVQVLGLASMIFPVVREWVAENPVEFSAVWAAVNLVLRYVTQGKVFLLDDDTADRLRSLSPLVVVMGMGAVLLGVSALPSCRQLEDMPIRATLLLEDGAVSYSRAGGLEVGYSGK